MGITGGIASGKSYVCHQLEAAGHPVFYCDDEAKRIIRTAPAVRRELSALVGPEVYTPEGQLNKPVLSAWLCRGQRQAHQVNAIVHPRVAEAFAARAAALEAAALATALEATAQKMLDLGAAAQEMPDLPADALTRILQASSREIDIATLAALPRGRVLFMECALLFEAAFDRFVHRSVLVHVRRETQLRRLMARGSGIDRAGAEAWIDLQMGEEEKMARADFWLDND